MMCQKIEYIHYNPVKRGFVDSPEHWRYSSARNYLALPSLIDVLYGLAMTTRTQSTRSVSAWRYHAERGNESRRGGS
jgi:hypothetical protein